MPYQWWFSQHLSLSNAQELTATLTGVITEGSTTARKEMLMREAWRYRGTSPWQTWSHPHAFHICSDFYACSLQSSTLPILKYPASKIPGNQYVQQTQAAENRLKSHHQTASPYWQGTGLPYPSQGFGSVGCTAAQRFLQPRGSSRWWAHSSLEPKRSGRTGPGIAPEWVSASLILCVNSEN